jgi:cytochrome c oxidase subunit 1
VHAVGFVLLLGAAMAGAISAVVPVRGDSAWAEGHLLLLFWAAPVMALSAAAFYWAPKLWGRHLSEALGYLQFLLLFGGSLVALGPYYLGLRDQPRYALDVSDHFRAWDRVATLGGFLVAIALVLFMLNLAGSIWARRGRLAAADPWEAGTPEWASPDDRAPVTADEAVTTDEDRA